MSVLSWGGAVLGASALRLLAKLSVIPKLSKKAIDQFTGFKKVGKEKRENKVVRIIFFDDGKNSNQQFRSLPLEKPPQVILCLYRRTLTNRKLLLDDGPTDSFTHCG
jgi:hypothetical protein